MEDTPQALKHIIRCHGPDVRINDQWRISFTWDGGDTRWRLSITIDRKRKVVRIGNIHSGEVLREDFLIPLEMSPYALAMALGISPTAVGEIRSGKRSVTAATAQWLQRFFGAEAEFWLNLQAMYDLEEERNRLAEKLEAIKPCALVSG